MKLKLLLDYCLGDVFIFRRSGERGMEYLYEGITVAVPKELQGCEVAYFLADVDNVSDGMPAKISICLRGVK